MKQHWTISHAKSQNVVSRELSVNRMCVIIASIGRAEQLCQSIDWLRQQTRPPDFILVVSVTAEDVAGVDAISGLPLEVIFAEKGLPRQRNAGLHHLGNEADIIVFFDDDFVPSRHYLAVLEELFDTRPELVGATGRLIADGIKSRGISFAQAVRLVDEDLAPQELHERLMPALYGCNLSARASAVNDLWFDEKLPLYGWQEDVDFSYRLGRRGPLLLTSRLAGVHMGAKGGRTSGRQLGYSQIANPVYLLRKKTIPPKLALRLIARNITANLFKSMRPEPYIDRRGRLVGNLLAFRDLLTGTIDPRHVLEL